MAVIEKRLRTVGVVLAGGVGTRVGLGTPKQLLKIAGKSIIEHTLAAFEAAPEIDEIIVLMTAGYVDDINDIVKARSFRKVTSVIEGGVTRNDSTRNALDALGAEECNVLFHDAVRPLVSQRIVRECVNALRTYEAVDVGIPSADTIVVVDANETITDIPDRSRLRRGQTPQAFRLSTIRRAYELAWQDPDFHATDDCSVVLKYLPDVPIHMVEGDESNMKVTQAVDLFIADKLFQLNTTTVERLGSTAAYSERLRGRTAVIFGGSYGIGGEMVSLLQSYGATVFSFSRSATGTHVEDPRDVQEALDKAYSASGRIDYIVVTAGVLDVGKLSDADDATIASMINVNYVAPVQIARLGIDYLEQSNGQLLLFTSSSYTRGRAGYSLYSSTKAAVVNLTQALAEEWAELGVQVNCINPERTATPMRTKAFGVEPPENLLDAGEVAQTSVDVLISHITGQVIDVRRATPTVTTTAASVAEAVKDAVERQEAAAADEAAREHDEHDEPEEP